jgi:hypothetical protein
VKIPADDPIARASAEQSARDAMLQRCSLAYVIADRSLAGSRALAQWCGTFEDSSPQLTQWQGSAHRYFVNLRHNGLSVTTMTAHDESDLLELVVPKLMQRVVALDCLCTSVLAVQAEVQCRIQARLADCAARAPSGRQASGGGCASG